MAAIELPDDIENRLAAVAEVTGLSKSALVQEAIIEHLDDLEDLFLAEQRLADIRAGRTNTIPLDEVMKQYGLAD